eukprot:scaffold11340_cov21-Prasinocladus_malaysianus.AAC.1
MSSVLMVSIVVTLRMQREAALTGSSVNYQVMDVTAMKGVQVTHYGAARTAVSKAMQFLCVDRCRGI